MNPGFVYLLRADNGLHKIGRSGCPDERADNAGVFGVKVKDLTGEG